MSSLLRRTNTHAALFFATIAAVALATNGDAHAGVCSASDFSCPSSGTCVISGTWNVDDECVLDFGDRGVEISGLLRATTVGASFGIKAASLSLVGGKLRSQGDTYNSGGNIDLEVAGLFEMRSAGARIETDGGGGGGDIDVLAGSVSFQGGVIKADGGSGDSCGGGGSVSISATGPISVAGYLQATTPGGECDGGQIAVTGASAVITGDIDASGGSGANEEAISIETSAGDIAVLSGAHLRAEGRGQNEGFGADGGGITMRATAGAIRVGGTITATGKSPTGSGGAVQVEAATQIEITAEINVRSGNAASGGGVHLVATQSIEIRADIVGVGGSSFPSGFGGQLRLRTQGMLTVAALLDTSAATAGSVVLEAGGPLNIAGTIRAQGVRGDGGIVRLNGCAVEVTSWVDVSAASGGAGGRIEIVGSVATISSTATLRATPCGAGDCNSITTGPDMLTVQPGASITPAIVAAANSGLPLCGGG